MNNVGHMITSHEKITGEICNTRIRQVEIKREDSLTEDGDRHLDLADSGDKVSFIMYW